MKIANGSWSNLDVGLLSLIPIAVFRNIGVVLPVLPPPKMLVFRPFNALNRFPIVSLINTFITIYMNMSERTQKYKGKFTPENPSKYAGDSNNIIYRSMWERRCMKYFDNNPSILQWASEEVVIPYYDTALKRCVDTFLIF